MCRVGQKVAASKLFVNYKQHLNYYYKLLTTVNTRNLIYVGFLWQ